MSSWLKMRTGHEVIGPFATLLGDEGVNIASMKVARQTKGDKAIMLVNVTIKWKKPY